jgi:hypothetical protein
MRNGAGIGGISGDLAILHLISPAYLPDHLVLVVELAFDQQVAALKAELAEAELLLQRNGRSICRVDAKVNLPYV